MNEYKMLVRITEGGRGEVIELTLPLGHMEYKNARNMVDATKVEIVLLCA